MATEADTEVATKTAETIAAAIDAGWTLEAVQDLLEAMWPEMILCKARFLVEDALREAGVKRP